MHGDKFWFIVTIRVTFGVFYVMCCRLIHVTNGLSYSGMKHEEYLSLQTLFRLH